MRLIIALPVEAWVSRRGQLLAGWALALLGAAVFARLGVWQLDRAHLKEQQLAAAAHVLKVRTALPLAAAGNPDRLHGIDWAQGDGKFIATPGIFHDNEQRDGVVGVRSYGVFQPDAGAPLLVDLGWQPFSGDRVLPRYVAPTATRVAGLLVAPPSAGLRVGAAMARQADDWLLLRVEPVEITRALALKEPLAPRVLRLDPALPFGYPRDLRMLTNTLTPERHRGYAVQWFGLAATALVIALVLTFRRSRR